MGTRRSTPGTVTNGEGTFMTTREVSALTGIPQSTLRYWRHSDLGPPSFSLGPSVGGQGRVVYRRAAVMAWIAQQEQATGRGGHPGGA